MITSIESLLSFAQSLADEAARMVAEHLGADISVTLKPDRTFVTELDQAIEARLREQIADRYPDHGILGEEMADRPAHSDFTWVLDPIDGTAALVAGMPVYGTLIALAHQDHPILGVMHFPATQERWAGAQGLPTLHNGKPCQVRSGESLASAIMSASNPDFFDAHEKRALAALSAHTAWRIYGGAALSYGRLAMGRTDLALDAGLKVHDYAAFVPILQGAGGLITDWTGQALTLHSGSRVLAAGDPRRHAAALAVIQEALG
jgi:inositol-phosphate phosphatase/L-galactose 1-phosphate phosphatase/histidinol-phosphatase